jgi:hypothetical protein
MCRHIVVAPHANGAHQSSGFALCGRDYERSRLIGEHGPDILLPRLAGVCESHEWRRVDEQLQAPNPSAVPAWKYARSAEDRHRCERSRWQARNRGRAKALARRRQSPRAAPLPASDPPAAPAVRADPHTLVFRMLRIIGRHVGRQALACATWLLSAYTQPRGQVEGLDGLHRLRRAAMRAGRGQLRVTFTASPAVQIHRPDGHPDAKRSASAPTFG